MIVTRHVETLEKTADPYLEIRVSGKLTREDYLRFVPDIEARIRKHGKLRILFNMDDFRGWTPGAVWENVKFDARHFADIDRLAIVGESRWQKGMAVFCKPFTSATVRYFDRTRIDEARRWLELDGSGEEGRRQAGVSS